MRIAPARRDPTLQRSRSLFGGNSKTALALDEFEAFFSNDTSWSLGKTKKCELGMERSKNMQKAGPRQPTPRNPHAT